MIAISQFYVARVIVKYHKDIIRVDIMSYIRLSVDIVNWKITFLQNKNFSFSNNNSYFGYST